MWVVMASSITAAQAARLIHRAITFRPGRGVIPVVCSWGSDLMPDRLCQAAKEQLKANTANPTDQRIVWPCVVKRGSTSTGKLSRASMEPKLERANSLYGTTPLLLCRYQACNKGPVEESRRYGRPIVAASRPRM